jgi:hypothetical protein
MQYILWCVLLLRSCTSIGATAVLPLYQQYYTTAANVSTTVKAWLVADACLLYERCIYTLNIAVHVWHKLIYKHMQQHVTPFIKQASALCGTPIDDTLAQGLATQVSTTTITTITAYTVHMIYDYVCSVHVDTIQINVHCARVLFVHIAHASTTTDATTSDAYSTCPL